MIIVRCKVKCHPGQAERALGALREVIAAARPVEGVVSFDIGRDVADPDSFVGVQVYADRAALQRAESLPAVAGTMERLVAQCFAAPPQETVFDLSASEAA